VNEVKAYKKSVPVLGHPVY